MPDEIANVHAHWSSLPYARETPRRVCCCRRRARAVPGLREHSARWRPGTLTRFTFGDTVVRCGSEATARTGDIVGRSPARDISIHSARRRVSPPSACSAERAPIAAISCSHRVAFRRHSQREPISERRVDGSLNFCARAVRVKHSEALNNTILTHLTLDFAIDLSS